MKRRSVPRLEPHIRTAVQAACDEINAELRQQRERLAYVSIAVVLLGALWVWLCRAWNVPLDAPGIAVLVALWLWMAWGSGTSVNDRYKEHVIARICASMHPPLEYRTFSSLSSFLFDELRLFAEGTGFFRSEDQLSGTRNNVKYAIHEACAYSSDEHKSGILFSGLIILLEFNKHFTGHTVVVPQGERGETSWPAGFGIARMENTAFEKAHDVLTTDDQQARYVLTPMMELVARSEAALDTRLRMAFHDNHFAVAISQTRDRFDLGFFDNATPEGAIGDLWQVSRLAENLVDTLDLETRIWTRV